MISSLLGGTTNIKDLFSQKLEPFSLFSSSSSDAPGNDATATGTTTTGATGDASGNGGMFGNTFSLFSSSSSDGNTTTATNQNQNGNADGSNGSGSTPTPTSTDANSDNTADANASGGNTNPSIAPYADFFKSLFYLFVQICIIGYLGSSFLTLVRMSNSKRFLNRFMPSDVNAYPYCTPSDSNLAGQGAQHVEIEDDSLYSFGFPYNMYCDPEDEAGNTCSKTCGVIKRELKDPNAFFGYTPFSFWLAMSSKNTYAAFRAFIKMVCTSLNSVLRQDESDSYGIVENVIMAIGVLFIYIVGLCGGFLGFFMTYAFQIYNSGFMMFGLAWTFGLILLSWIPPLLNFFGFIFQSILLFLWIPFTQINQNTQSKIVFEIFKTKKSLMMLLFSLGMVMNAFNYLKGYEPYYVVVAVALFLFNMYAF
jgi:hypothetical protein